MILADIETALAPSGLMARGGFEPGPADGVPGDPATLVLVGNAGPAMWDAFAAATPAGERAGAPDPLDDWTRTRLDRAARDLGASALYPFTGPPYLPFQRWAVRTGGVHPSPTGPLIDPVFGLWHAYRGALAFNEPIDLPRTGPVPSPCETCRDKPCLRACPVAAFEPGDGIAAAYDVAACVGHVTSDAGAECRDRGCLARRACPVGQEYVYSPAQAAFHMARFVTAQARR